VSTRLFVWAVHSTKTEVIMLVAPDGHSYEESAIRQWISVKGTSPITNASFVRAHGPGVRAQITLVSFQFLVRSKEQYWVGAKNYCCDRFRPPTTR
jgi:hypothetical protein